MLVEANNAFDRITSLIIQADGRWQWDDSNNTDLPIAVADLVANQQDYTLSAAHLELTRAEIKDQNGNWNLLDPIDQTDVYNQSLTDFMKTAGLPVYYDKLAGSVFLYPKPNYSQADSLKLYFQRPPSYFVLGDTTKQPGFNSLYHELIPLWIAYNFAIANGKENGTAIYKQIQDKEEAMIADYALRGKDDHIRMRRRPQSFR